MHTHTHTHTHTRAHAHTHTKTYATQHTEISLVGQAIYKFFNVDVSMIEVRISDVLKKLSHESRFTVKLNRQKNVLVLSTTLFQVEARSKKGKRRGKKQGERQSRGERL